MRTAIGASLPRLRMLPILFAVLAILTVIPVGQALVELIVRPVTVVQLVERRVGLSTRLVAVDGLALLVPFAADPPAQDAAPSLVYHWYAVRDSLQERHLVLVRSPIALEALQTRTVVAEVVHAPAVVRGTVAGLVARGGADPGARLEPVMLTEVEAGAASVTDLGSLADIGSMSAGSMVRITLRFGDGIASCVARGNCQARALANGIGSWDNLATDPAEGRSVVVRTAYPPSVAPFHGVGHHAQDRDLVERFLAEPVARGALGWGQVLFVAHVEHDLGLPIDRLWLGPIAFTSFALLLLLGLRLGYPRFRATGRPARPTEGAGLAMDGPIEIRASGRLSPPDASPFEVDDVAARLTRNASEGATLSLELPEGRREIAIPRDLGGLGATEFGDLLTLTGRLPAMNVGWFGSNVRLVFRDAASRDAAELLLRRRG